MRHENLLIDQRNKRLEETNIRLGQKEQALFLKERDVVIREAKIMEAEPFLSIARRLQNTGLEFEAILPWIETVTEVAQGTDPRTAAQYIAYELSAFRKLGGLQKELESVQKQLEMLKTVTAQRERGLNMLAELESKGVSLDVVYELSRVLDLQKIAAELALRTDPWSNFSQCVVGHNGYINGYNPSKSQYDSNHVNNDLPGVNNSETTNNGHVVDIEKSK